MKKLLSLIFVLPMVAGAAENPNLHQKLRFDTQGRQFKAPAKSVVGENVACACEGQYNVGDRVVALVNSPSNADGILEGATGTVVSGTDDASPVLLISWDYWSSGHNGNGYAECPVASVDNSSAWFVNCGEVERVGGGDLTGLSGCVSKDGTAQAGAREAILNQPGVLTVVSPVDEDSCYSFPNAVDGKPYNISINGQL